MAQVGVESTASLVLSLSITHIFVSGRSDRARRWSRRLRNPRRIGVYYAICGAKFPGSHRTVNLRFLSSCPYKLWINRAPAKGRPEEGGGNFGGGILSHGGTDGWNELLFKFVVPPAQKTPAGFWLRFRRSSGTFGRPIDEPLPFITIEPQSAFGRPRITGFCGDPHVEVGRI